MVSAFTSYNGNSCRGWGETRGRAAFEAKNDHPSPGDASSSLAPAEAGGRGAGSPSDAKLSPAVSGRDCFLLFGSTTSFCGQDSRVPRPLSCKPSLQRRAPSGSVRSGGSDLGRSRSARLRRNTGRGRLHRPWGKGLKASLHSFVFPFSAKAPQSALPPSPPSTHTTRFPGRVENIHVHFRQYRPRSRLSVCLPGEWLIS